MKREQAKANKRKVNEVSEYSGQKRKRPCVPA